jgi:hypothetical protein
MTSTGWVGGRVIANPQSDQQMTESQGDQPTTPSPNNDLLFGVLVVLGMIDDWRVVVRGGDAASVQQGEIYRIVWARVPVRDFPSGNVLGVMVLEKARCRVIEVYEQYAVMQSIADPETTPWLVAHDPDMPPIAVGDEVERMP